MDTTLLKGLRILEALIHSERSRGVTELAAELGLAKSNVHRVLKTLQEAGYVRQPAEAATYVPTLKVWELGEMVRLRLDLTRESRPHLMQLAELTRETIHLSVLDGFEVVYIDKIDSPEPVRAYSTLGGRAPAHCVATGKVLLALSQDAGALASANAGEHTFKAYTAKTLTSPADLAAAFAEIRLKGFSVNWGEWRDSVRGLAAPIRDARGSVIAAVGVSGPAERLTRNRIAEAVPHVIAAAEGISSALGFQHEAVPLRKPVARR